MPAPEAQVEAPPSRPDPLASGWLLLGLVFLLFGFLYSVIQPPTALPDESAHIQYVRFLVEERRLPRWELNGGGEAGYEAQHPPLAYVLYGIPWMLGSGLGESMQWHLVRWWSVLLGLMLLPLMRALGRLLFPAQPREVLLTAATVMLLPLTLLYFCHANPDGVAMLLVTSGLVAALKLRAAPAEGATRWAALGGVIAGAALLTKLSAAPILVVLLAAPWFNLQLDRPLRLRATLIVGGLVTLVAGWWYVRSLLLYGSPFIHTATRLGTGWEGAVKGPGPLLALVFTLMETYLSTWAQRFWVPAGFDLALYGLLTLLVLAAITGSLVHRRDFTAPDRWQRGVCLALFLMVLAGQQAAFWTQDVELNAGGRYVLVAFPGLAALLIAGLGRWRRAGPVLQLLPALILVTMNVLAAQHITAVLTPHYYPGWKMFEFPRQVNTQPLEGTEP